MTSSGFTGGCLCGNIRYACSTDPVVVVFCHCKDCQRCTGSAFAPVAVVQASDLKVLQGQTRSRSVTGEDGGVVFREFCPDCGSPLFSGLEANRSMIGVKAGCMDDSSRLQPTVHIWTDSAVAWLPLREGLPKLPRNPPARPRSAE